MNLLLRRIKQINSIDKYFKNMDGRREGLIFNQFANPLFKENRLMGRLERYDRQVS